VLFVDAVLVMHCVMISTFVTFGWHTAHDVDTTVMAWCGYGVIVLATAVVSVVQHTALWHTTTSRCCCDHVATHSAFVV
jgi:hypothetical protein